MLKLESCRKILNQEENKYTKEEIEAIRTILYQIANVDYQNYKNHLDGKEGRNLR